jgi:hypothetical protein
LPESSLLPLPLDVNHVATLKVHPFDDPMVIAGQGTTAMEILKKMPVEDPDAIFVCVGGGGLLAGVAAYVKAIKPHIKVIGVEADDAAGMTASLHSGRAWCSFLAIMFHSRMQLDPTIDSANMRCVCPIACLSRVHNFLPFVPANHVGTLRGILPHGLTMNSATALMTSHNTEGVCCHMV